MCGCRSQSSHKRGKRGPCDGEALNLSLFLCRSLDVRVTSKSVRPLWRLAVLRVLCPL